MTGVVSRRVTEGESGMRLDRWFRTHYPGLRHTLLEKLLRKGQVRVDGGRVKANRRLEAGETVRVPPMSTDDAGPPVAAGSRLRAGDVDEDRAALHAMTIYEDDAVIALNKPFGLPVQGGVNSARNVDAMLAALERDGERPRLVHRLDRDTGGLLLLARTRSAAATLGGALQRREIDKVYWALVVGAPRPREGVIDMKIATRMVRVADGEQERVVPAEDEDAKKAITEFQTVDDAGGGVAFLALRPVTGRKHQIRVHCAAIGHPVVGDRKYGGARATLGGVAPKLHLFCRSMSFRHPTTGRTLTITAPLAGHMRDTWRFFAFDQEAAPVWPQEKT